MYFYNFQNAIRCNVTEFIFVSHSKLFKELLALLIHAVLRVPTPQMVKHTQTIFRLLPTNFLSVFDHFVRLALAV